MMSQPKFSCYTDHKSGNYGLNSLVFEVDGRDFYFSYQTLIAFRGRDGQLRVIRNYWSTTTGRHLNAIDGGNKKSRLSGVEFAEAYQKEMIGD